MSTRIKHFWHNALMCREDTKPGSTLKSPHRYQLISLQLKIQRCEFQCVKGAITENNNQFIK